MEIIFNEAFIEKWQTLIGAALGSSLTIIFSLVGIVIKNRWESKKQREENMRRLEIAITEIINSVQLFIEGLQEFIPRLEKILQDIETVDLNSYFINDTNFPSLIKIHVDPELKKTNLKSYYLHNKILMVSNLLQWGNALFSDSKSNFKEIRKKNELFVTQKISTSSQRKNYKLSLISYIKTVKGLIKFLQSHIITNSVQTKIYNEKLRKGFIWNSWKYEGVRFKYFKNESEIEDYKTSLERVDKLIANECELLISKLAPPKD